MSGEFDLIDPRHRPARLDGFEVLRSACVDEGSTMPVIILTARDSVADTVAGLEGGADDYMTKPFRFEELLARVRLRLRDRTAEGRSATVCAHGDLSPGPADPAGQLGRSPRGPHRPGVRAAGDVHAAPGPGAQPRAAARPRSGATTSTRAPTWSTCTSAICGTRSPGRGSRRSAAPVIGWDAERLKGFSSGSAGNVAMQASSRSSVRPVTWRCRGVRGVGARRARLVGGVAGLVGVTVSPGVCGLAGVTVLVPSGVPVAVGSLGSAEGPVVAAATTTPDPAMG